jgi:hypothetical protein
MESLPYFFLFLVGIAVASLLSISTLILIAGVVLLVSRVWKRGTLAHGSVGVAAAMILLGGCFLISLGSWAARAVYTMGRNLQRANEPLLCLELPVQEGYQLSILHHADRAWGYLETVDDRQILVSHIKEYTIEGDIMVGKDSFNYWFWVDLSTGGLEQGLTKTQYRAALRRFGFVEEPTLMTIHSLCKIHDCVPCPATLPYFNE